MRRALKAGMDRFRGVLCRLPRATTTNEDDETLMGETLSGIASSSATGLIRADNYSGAPHYVGLQLPSLWR